MAFSRKSIPGHLLEKKKCANDNTHSLMQREGNHIQGANETIMIIVITSCVIIDQLKNTQTSSICSPRHGTTLSLVEVRRNCDHSLIYWLFCTQPHNPACTG